MKQVKENMNANSKQTIQTSFYYTTVLPIEVYSREVHAVFSYFFLMSVLPLLLLAVLHAYESAPHCLKEMYLDLVPLNLL